MKAAGFLTNCLIIVFGKDKIMQVSRVSFSSIQLESGSCTICIPLKKVISFYAQLFADMKFPFTTYMCITLELVVVLVSYSACAFTFYL